MVVLLQRFPPSSSTIISLPSLNLKRKHNCKPTHLTFPLRTPLKPQCFKSSRVTRKTPSAASPIPPLLSLQPFLQSQWKPILKGWTCGVISVYSLSKLVPRVGQFSTILNRVDDVVLLREQGLVLGVLFLARLLANYWQQAFLWDAALNLVYEIRLYVFRRVMQRDLAFFEGGGGVSAGDIAYRITAEASDVANAVYSLLNAIVPCTLHLIAMATQMLVISPILSLISALVIPCMALVISYLGERLRKISRKAQLRVASLSAYLNEVFPSILFVKANNTELHESARFQRLVNADLFEHLKKKRIKLLIPQIVRIVYFGALSTFCVCSLVISRGSIDACSIISFVTSLVLLIEPIQGLEKAYNDWKQVEPAVERLFDLTRFKSQILFSGTVAENIGYRDLMSEIDMERVELAARIANVDEFIRSLPEGYKTNIGPRGSILSGGQKQRLAIARALYQNSSVLILDEATSALDSRSELLVRRAVERVMKNHTVLVIAHRLETVLMANRVFLLEDGKLEELARSSLLRGLHGSPVSTGTVI
ncbi:ABC transporter B family member 29, chloroplastic isoform X2 [Malania oleifera]|uniref:ABC transporter B family member 29, chloroplastic isoform X2 n=1 Tax=Malania oleifera TaxID=397392 RepID=UPI0025AE4F15|nr:ABC transporter B family member 29, chloroplastic isoform X2 [Malania oleifera]